MALGLSPESLARRSSRRPWITISVWVLVLLIAAVLIVTLLGDTLTTDIEFRNNPESIQADDLLGERFYVPGQTKEVTEVILVRSPDRTVDDSAFEEFAEGIFGSVSQVIPQPTDFDLAWDNSLVSLDRHTTGLIFTFIANQDNYSKFFNAFLDDGKAESSA